MATTPDIIIYTPAGLQLVTSNAAFEVDWGDGNKIGYTANNAPYEPTTGDVKVYTSSPSATVAISAIGKVLNAASVTIDCTERTNLRLTFAYAEPTTTCDITVTNSHLVTDWYQCFYNSHKLNIVGSIVLGNTLTTVSNMLSNSQDIDPEDIDFSGANAVGFIFAHLTRTTPINCDIANATTNYHSMFAWSSTPINLTFSISPASVEYMFNDNKGGAIEVVSWGPLVSAKNLFATSDNGSAITLDTSPNLIESANRMFYACKTSYVSSMYMENITDMYSMFKSSYITSAPDMYAPSALTASSMFSTCPYLTQLPSVNIPISTNNTSMFKTCSGATGTPPTITSTVEFSADSMFSACNSMTDLPILNYELVSSMVATFDNCYDLVNTYAITINPNKNVSMSSTFNSCHSLESNAFITMSPLSTYYQRCFEDTPALLQTDVFLQYPADFGFMFNESGIKNFPDIDTTIATSLHSMVKASGIEHIPSFTTTADMQYMSYGALDLLTVGDIHLTSGYSYHNRYAFTLCAALHTVGTLTRNGNATFEGVFASTESLSYIPEIVSDQTIINIAGMFENSTGLINIPNGALDKFTNMTSAFENSAVQTVGDSYNASPMIALGDMFLDCVDLISVGKIDAVSGNNIGTSGMFEGALSLTTFGGLGNINIKNRVDMFKDATSLECVGSINTGTGAVATSTMFDSHPLLQHPTSEEITLLEAGGPYIYIYDTCSGVSEPLLFWLDIPVLELYFNGISTCIADWVGVELAMIECTPSTKTSGVVIDGDTTTLNDISNFADVSAITALGNYTSNSTYGVTWTGYGWSADGAQTDSFTVNTANITTVEVEWTGLFGSDSLGKIGILFFDISGIEIPYTNRLMDPWDDNSRGQLYYKNDVEIFYEVETEVINDRYIIQAPSGSHSVHVYIEYLNGYNLSPRYINYLKITSDDYA